MFRPWPRDNLILDSWINSSKARKLYITSIFIGFCSINLENDTLDLDFKRFTKNQRVEAANIANLGQLGAFRQGLEQSRLQADMDAARTGAYEPYQRLSTYGTGITGLAGGVAGQQFQDPATPSPFSTALSTALGIGGLFGKFR